MRQEVIAGQLFLIKHYTHKSPEAAGAVVVLAQANFLLMVVLMVVVAWLAVVVHKQTLMA
jgi:hypothetical protein